MLELPHEKTIRKNLLIDAKAVGIPIGSAEIFVDNTLKSVKSSLKQTTITENQFKAVVHKELKKYNADFAYVYKNRDKII